MHELGLVVNAAVAKPKSLDKLKDAGQRRRSHGRVAEGWSGREWWKQDG